LPDSDTGGGYAFVVLLHDEDDASGLARLLEDVRMPEATVASVFAAPPMRGLDFFSDDTSQATLDEWWAAEIPKDATPVYLLMHEDGLAEWLKGMDGLVYIGIPPGDKVDEYAQGGSLHTFSAGGPLDFATIIMRDFSNPENDESDPKCIFDHGEAVRMAALSSDFPIDLDDTAFDFGPPPEAQAPAFGAAAGSPFGAPPGSPFGAPPGSPFGAPTPPYGAVPPYGAPQAPTPPTPPRVPAAATTPNPFDLLTGGGGTPAPPAQPPTPTAAPANDYFSQQPADPSDAPVPFPPAAPAQPASNLDWASGTSQPQAPAPYAPERARNYPSSQETGKSSRFELPSLPFFKGRGSGRSSYTPAPDRDLAQAIVDRGPMLIVMGSRKGGVGKTSYAAGIAIVAGQVLDAVGHKAAIVDANIANPDAWGQMNLREGAATVREVVAALTANREPPPPVFSTTPALACYPESRETTEYSKTDVSRFSDYLKRRYTFIVVDMSNRLPDPMAGPEAAAAAYWLEHADVLVLPTTSSKQDFNGVLDYLDVRDLPPTVVPYIIPKVKRNREHPVTQQYLAVIRDRVHRIVEVPDEADKVRFAGMEGIPVERVSPSLRNAYRELTETIVQIPPRVTA
jgi:MinD-like ATPase involved in chromosome partitioning or flagellar assembly